MFARSYSYDLKFIYIDTIGTTLTFSNSININLYGFLQPETLIVIMTYLRTILTKCCLLSGVALGEGNPSTDIIWYSQRLRLSQYFLLRISIRSARGSMQPRGDSPPANSILKLNKTFQSLSAKPNPNPLWPNAVFLKHLLALNPPNDYSKSFRGGFMTSLKL